MMRSFQPGDEALVRDSFEVVTVIAQDGDTVLVKRGGGQAAYRLNALEPYVPDFCPLD